MPYVRDLKTKGKTQSTEETKLLLVAFCTQRQFIIPVQCNHSVHYNHL